MLYCTTLYDIVLLYTIILYVIIAATQRHLENGKKLHTDTESYQSLNPRRTRELANMNLQSEDPASLLGVANPTQP